MTPYNTLTVATWNTARRSRPEMVDLLTHADVDVLCLQEVTVDTWSAFAAVEGWTGHAFGLQHRPRAVGEGQGRSLGAAIFVRTPAGVLESGVIDSAGIAQPERVVTAVTRTPCCSARLTLLSYHALNGEKGADGLNKPRTTGAVARWLGGTSGSVIAGMDANSPAIDHPDENLIECHFQESRWAAREMERSMLGPMEERVHGLFDVWRTYLAERPGETRALLRYQPTGPLAATHFTGGRRVRYPVRFDHIWVTPDFAVLDVQHMHEAFSAGSDHALVVAQVAHRCG